MKKVMTLAGVNGVNWTNLSKAERDKLRTNVSLGSIKSVERPTRSACSKRSRGSAKSKSSTKSSKQRSSIKKAKSSRSISARTRDSHNKKQKSNNASRASFASRSRSAAISKASIGGASTRRSRSGSFLGTQNSHSAISGRSILNRTRKINRSGSKSRKTHTS